LPNRLDYISWLTFQALSRGEFVSHLAISPSQWKANHRIGLMGISSIKFRLSRTVTKCIQGTEIDKQDMKPNWNRNVVLPPFDFAGLSRTLIPEPSAVSRGIQLQWCPFVECIHLWSRSTHASDIAHDHLSQRRCLNEWPPQRLAFGRHSHSTCIVACQQKS
jgi:hypothetical protein